MAYQAQNPQLQSLYGTLFNYDNVSGVYALHRGWAFEYYLVDILNGGTSKPVNSPDGSYIKWFQNRVELTGQIQTATQNGLTIDLVLYDPTSEIFRKKRVLKNNRSGSTARVIGGSPGKISIENNFNSSGTITANTDWSANDFFTDLGDTSGNRYSSGSSQIFQNVDNRIEYSMVRRYTAEFARRDALITYAGKQGVIYKYSAFEKAMVDDAMKSYGLATWYSKGGTGTSLVEGFINGTRGIDESIVQDGLAINGTAPFTIDEFYQMSGQSIDANPSLEQELVFMAGRDGIARMQTFAPFGTFFIQYSRDVVTEIGGQKLRTNTDVREAIINGITYKIVNKTLLNNSRLFPQPSNIPGINGTINGNSIYLLNFAPIPSVDEGDGIKMLPAIEKFHWADNNMRQDNMIYKVITGMSGPNGQHTGPDLGGYETTSNPIDGWSCELLQDIGISCMADTWSRWKPVS